MKTVQETWGAAEAKSFVIPGRYFRLLATVSPVDVEFFQGGRHLSEEKASGVEAGYFSIPPKGFSEFKITSALAQTIKFATTAGSGGYDRNIGDVQVTSGLITALGPRALSGAPVLADLPVLTRDIGAPYGASFQSNTAIAIGTNETVLAPGSNTNGVIVWRSQIFTLQTAAANYTQLSLLAKASAPGSAIDGDLLLFAGSYIMTAVGMINAQALAERPILVAAGKGLYFRNSGTTEVLGVRSIQYTVL